MGNFTLVGCHGTMKTTGSEKPALLVFFFFLWISRALPEFVGNAGFHETDKIAILVDPYSWRRRVILWTRGLGHEPLQDWKK